MPKITVAIPTHDMKDKKLFLARALDSLWIQTMQDFDVVVSDNSEDTELKGVCDYYKGGITYFQNPRKGMAQNTNEAIKQSTGKLIKILYMDDCLAHEDALHKIWAHFKSGWLVTGCEHELVEEGLGFRGIKPHRPSYDGIESGQNTIGSPSVLTIENKDPLMFDENMTWLLDVDYYKRLFRRYGPPTILKDLNVVMGLGPHQMTHILSDEEKLREADYLNKKHD